MSQFQLNRWQVLLFLQLLSSVIHGLVWRHPAEKGELKFWTFSDLGGSWFLVSCALKCGLTLCNLPFANSVTEFCSCFCGEEIHRFCTASRLRWFPETLLLALKGKMGSLGTVLCLAFPAAVLCRASCLAQVGCQVFFPHLPLLILHKPLNMRAEFRYRREATKLSVVCALFVPWNNLWIQFSQLSCM